MKKNNLKTENYLKRRPVRSDLIVWSSDESGRVTLEIENTGIFNRIAQKLFGKPKISYVHLDETGSFIWPLLDGNKDITAIGKYVEERFGKEVYPLYERLAKYFQIMDSYHFINWNDNKKGME